MTTAKDELHHAAEEIHRAASALADHLIGSDARKHLRQAARHALQAGLASLDECERKEAKCATAEVKVEPKAAAGA